MQQTQEKPIGYSPMVHIVKNRVDIYDGCIAEQPQNRVRDTSTREEYFAAFIKHVGVYLMQPLEWLFNVGRFEPIGDPVQVMPSVEIIGTVTEVYEIYRVQNVFEYEQEAANNA